MHQSHRKLMCIVEMILKFSNVGNIFELQQKRANVKTNAKHFFLRKVNVLEMLML